jgi:hypothetical protein
VPKDVIDALGALATACNMEQYKHVLESVRAMPMKKFAKLDAVVDYVDDRFRNENIVVHLNLERAQLFVRYGQSTNNPCEQFFASVHDFLTLPLGR